MKLRLFVKVIVLLLGAILVGVAFIISNYFGPFSEFKGVVKFDNSHCPSERNFDGPVEISLRANSLPGLSKYSFWTQWTLDFGEQKGLIGGWMDSENQLWFSGKNGALIVVDPSYIAYYPTGRVGECPIETGLPH